MSAKFFFISFWAIVVAFTIGIAIMNDASSWSSIKIMWGWAIGLTVVAIIGNRIYKKRSGL